MDKTLSVVFDGEVFRPETPVNLQPNTRYEITLKLQDSKLSQLIENYNSLAQVYNFLNKAEIENFLIANPELPKILLEILPPIQQIFNDVDFSLLLKPAYPDSQPNKLFVNIHPQGEKKQIQKQISKLQKEWWFPLLDAAETLSWPDKLEIAIEHAEISLEKAEQNFNRWIGTVEAPEDWSLEHDHYIHNTPKRYENNTNEG